MFLLFKACLLTVLLETGLFYVLGYREKDDMTIVACANVITNLTLNLTISLLIPRGPGFWLALMEGIVVAVEYLIYARAFGASKRLFLQTLAANLLSYGAGVLLF